MFGLSTLAVRIIAVLAVLLLVGGFLGVRSCQRANERAAQSRVDRGQGEAFKGSAGEAVNVITGVAANESAGAAIGRENEEEIRNAKGSDQRVDPAANNAGLRALCRRASRRSDPACRVFQPDPK